MATINRTRHCSAKEIFLQALERTTPNDRSAYLDFACGQDPLLRQRVVELLANHFEQDSFMKDPAVNAVKAAVTSPKVEGPAARIGRYRLLQTIGEGGMGIVYMAEQEEPVRRRVALKIIKLGMDTRQVVARFEAERQALALMDHPNIARVLDGGVTDTGRPYFVMELVPGVPVTEFCDMNRMSVAERLKLFIPVCQAIQSAHQKGIIHRDLKPSNILVTLNGGVPVPKVIDFGVAKATNQRLTDKTLFTHYGTMVGTPAYMSPEQADMTSLDVDTRADIYSLGVLLHELLTGTTPLLKTRLHSVGYSEMQRIIAEERPEPPSNRLSTMRAEQRSIVARNHGVSELVLAQAFPSDLDWIVMKCLEKDRSRRYQTANGLANDIQRHLNTEPVSARPPSWLYEFQKTVRRHWVGFGATAAVLAALALGVVVSSWQAVRARRAEQEKSRSLAKAQAAQAREAGQRQRAEAGESLAERLSYKANMGLAQQAWAQNQVGLVRQALADSATYPERGFEWYYWQRQTHLDLMTLRGHLGAVRAVAYSPDGRRIVTGSEDQTAQVWDAANGKELVTLRGHRASVEAVAFSPDGRRIVTASADQTTKVWETASGKELVTLRGHRASIVFVAFSPDGQRILTGSHDATARVWDATNGTELFVVRGHGTPNVLVAFSLDAQRVVIANGDQTARVWDAANGTELFTLDHHAPITAVAFSPDGQWIVTGGHDANARVWDAANGKGLITLKGHNAPILAVAVSQDGKRIVTGSEDQTVRTWETASGKLLFAAKGHSASVGAIAFSPDGQRIVTGSADHTAKVWEAANDAEPFTLRGHTDQISAVAFSPNGQWIVTGSADQSAKVWDAASAKGLRTLEGHSRPVRSVAFSPDSQRIVTCSGDGTARVWDTASGNDVPPLLLGRNGAILSVAFSPDGRRIVTGGDDRAAKVWDAGDGKELFPLKGHTDGIFAVAFSPDGQRIVTGSRDRTAKMWEAAKGTLVLTLTGHEGGITSAGFSPDSQRIITGGRDQTARVWDANSGRLLLTLRGHSDAILAVAFSPDGRRILTGSRDQTAKLWDAASGQEFLTLHGHTAYISSVAFSPDGHQIITASGDHTAKVWKEATTAKVDLWQREDQDAAKHLADLSRERMAAADLDKAARALDPGVIRRWLVLAPIAYGGRKGATGLAQEQVPHEANLQARGGDRIQVGEAELSWQEVPLDDYLIDFNQVSDVDTRWSAAYAVCYIESEADQSSLTMKVGSDDQSKVYLNGKEIYRREECRSYLPDQDVVTGVSLKAGLNGLVFKVVNETGDWLGSIRFTDAAGQPLKGIRVTLDPGKRAL
jgi:eukaryotic-like serine/threonine-protein kinase